VKQAGTMKGKVVVVTGGARGIGLASATALHNLGAKVAIGDIDEPAVKESGSKLGLEVYNKLDVTDHDSFSNFLDEVERGLGPIDVLINNAGIFPVGKIVDEPEAVTQRVLAINIYGVILGTKLAVRRMLKRGSGHIINIASLAGVTPAPGIASYCATKHAVLGFTDSVRAEYRGTGVRFSAVLPTLTNTEMIAGIASARGLKNAEPNDIAKAIIGLINKPKARVAVTRSAGAVTASTKFMPRGASEALRRALALDRIFTDEVDVQKRKSYEERARRL
jgi:NAD(P)-dependent dehydrogenase (short-subunit alcohol dehydrogenase family)